MDGRAARRSATPAGLRSSSLPSSPPVGPEVLLPLPVVAPFLFAVVASLALTYLCRAAARQLGLMDHPDARRIHTTPVPRLGGLAVMLAITLALLLANLLDDWQLLTWGDPPHLTVARVLVVGWLMCLIGALDDVLGMRPLVKFTLTIGAAVAGYAAGFRIEAFAIPHLGEIALGPASLPVTVLWIAIVSHAFNLVDGMDGLAAGIAMVALAAIGLSAALAVNGVGLLLAMVAIGALFGFLFFNQHPASIFLGDSGSLALGSLLAMLSVNSHDPARDAATLGLFPLMVLAYPVLDTTLAVARRWLRGVRFSSADRRHIHHRVLARGFGYQETLFVLYAGAAAAAGLGLVYRHGSREVFLLSLGATLGGSALLCWLLVRWLGYHELHAAASSLSSIVREGRRVVREKILVHDTAEKIAGLADTAGLERLLGDVASPLGLHHIELTRESARRRFGDESAGPMPHGRLWRLDWPVLPSDVEGRDPLVLRLWGTEDSGTRPHTAGRIALILGPAIEAWLTLPRQHELQAQHAGRRRGDTTEHHAVPASGRTGRRMSGERT